MDCQAGEAWALLGLMNGDLGCTCDRDGPKLKTILVFSIGVGWPNGWCCGGLLQPFVEMRMIYWRTQVETVVLLTWIGVSFRMTNYTWSGNEDDTGENFAKVHLVSVPRMTETTRGFQELLLRIWIQSNEPLLWWGRIVKCPSLSDYAFSEIRIENDNVEARAGYRIKTIRNFGSSLYSIFSAPLCFYDRLLLIWPRWKEQQKHTMWFRDTDYRPQTWWFC